jgi:RNA polymerase sigma factor (sigma-70 family)
MLDKNVVLSEDFHELGARKKYTLNNFSEIVSKHGRYVHNFISKKVWNKNDVDDIYQTTLLEAFKSFSSFRGESHPRTWICGIAYIVFKNYLRNKSVHSFEALEDLSGYIEKGQEFEDAPNLDLENPETIHERMELLSILQEAFEDLPEGMKETFESVVANGESYESAAKRYNIPVGTVRSRISRARQALRERCLDY